MEQIYLGVEKSSKNGDGSSEGIDWLNRCVEDYDRCNNHRYPLHGVTNAKSQGRDFIKRHVGHLIVQVVEHTLRCHPPR